MLITNAHHFGSLCGYSIIILGKLKEAVQETMTKLTNAEKNTVLEVNSENTKFTLVQPRGGETVLT